MLETASEYINVLQTERLLNDTFKLGSLRMYKIVPESFTIRLENKGIDCLYSTSCASNGHFTIRIHIKENESVEMWIESIKSALSHLKEIKNTIEQIPGKVRFKLSKEHAWVAAHYFRVEESESQESGTSNHKNRYKSNIRHIVEVKDTLTGKIVGEELPKLSESAFATSERLIELLKNTENLTLGD